MPFVLQLWPFLFVWLSPVATELPLFTQIYQSWSRALNPECLSLKLSRTFAHSALVSASGEARVDGGWRNRCSCSVGSGPLCVCGSAASAWCSGREAGAPHWRGDVDQPRQPGSELANTVVPAVWGMSQRAYRLRAASLATSVNTNVTTRPDQTRPMLILPERRRVLTQTRRARGCWGRGLLERRLNFVRTCFWCALTSAGFVWFVFFFLARLLWSSPPSSRFIFYLSPLRHQPHFFQFSSSWFWSQVRDLLTIIAAPSFLEINVIVYCFKLFFTIFYFIKSTNSL